MIRLLTRFDATSNENADAFQRQLEAIRENIGEESGHLSYRLYRAREDSTVLFADEEWRTQDDADAHVAHATESEASSAALALLACPPDTLTIDEF